MARSLRLQGEKSLRNRDLSRMPEAKGKPKLGGTGSPIRISQRKGPIMPLSERTVNVMVSVFLLKQQS